MRGSVVLQTGRTAPIGGPIDISAYNSSSNIYTCPKSGWIFCSVLGNIDASWGQLVNTKIGISYSVIDWKAYMGTYILVPVNAGDTVYFNNAGGLTSVTISFLL